MSASVTTAPPLPASRPARTKKQKGARLHRSGPMTYLIAFLFVLGRSYSAYRFGHHEATAAVVTSYYWHFVDVIWIGLFFIIYILR